MSPWHHRGVVLIPAIAWTWLQNISEYFIRTTKSLYWSVLETSLQPFTSRLYGFFKKYHDVK